MYVIIQIWKENMILDFDDDIRITNIVLQKYMNV